ncbi:hypothetical protein TST_1515 [Thermosulfidibacter takaii ABI70S6]|uniref:Lipoprotein n=1 Tax=Thermosulfidibacter takaii (strain DSM 17441 / JCM 13301 / NBRC 103674 / ABI70S6) TaxID=1298851 RepID=A0A0S3QVD7_THET7|nr:hypothetical protein [Thermosulfidibacter takaii]BAT72301.1 hypothetical protein TST_1515 [Thermosulfidibacter takaii ABI70S6]
MITLKNRQIWLFAFLTLILLCSCSSKVSITFDNTAYLHHTYSLYIEPNNDTLSKEFAEKFKETLRWEQYLYLPDTPEDADSIMKVKVAKRGNCYEVEMNITEKATNNKCQIKSTITADSLDVAAKALAYNLQSALELPPEVNAATPYYNLTDPSGGENR